MHKVNIQIEIPKALFSFFDFLPMGIRQKYLNSITTAVVQQNEKKITDDIKKVIKDLVSVAISEADVLILQADLDEALADMLIDMSEEEKKIKAKKSTGKIKKDGIVEEPTQPQVSKEEVIDDAPKYETHDDFKNNIDNSQQNISNEGKSLEQSRGKDNLNVKEMDMALMFSGDGKR